MAILYTIYIYILYTICKDLLYIFPNHHKECSSSANWESALNTSRWESRIGQEFLRQCRRSSDELQMDLRGHAFHNKKLCNTMQ